MKLLHHSSFKEKFRLWPSKNYIFQWVLSHSNCKSDSLNKINCTVSLVYEHILRKKIKCIYIKFLCFLMITGNNISQRLFVKVYGNATFGGFLRNLQNHAASWWEIGGGGWRDRVPDCGVRVAPAKQRWSAFPGLSRLLQSLEISSLSRLVSLLLQLEGGRRRSKIRLSEIELFKSQTKSMIFEEIDRAGYPNQISFYAEHQCRLLTFL